MIRRQLCLQGLALLVALAACTVRQQFTNDQACRAVAGDPAASGGVLQDCLDSLDPGAMLDLPPRRFVVDHPLILRRPVTLGTQGMTGARCPDDGAGCATLVLRLAAPGGPSQRAVTIAGSGVVIDHLVIEGGKADPTRDDTAICRGEGRPSMGGLGITGRQVTITNSVVRDVACYSAVVADAGADGFRFVGNAVFSNGTHDRTLMWADGLTVIDGVDDVVRDNLFRDNTDVQLVLGGCLRCVVAGNRIETSDAPGAGAFAGLLVHAWPNTSGDYADTAITDNSVDCGSLRRCGFGLAIGGRAWYVSPTFGGVIARNRVSRAGVGINVDEATGPVVMRDNQVSLSGGTAVSHCGEWAVGAVNIAPASRRFVDPTAGVAMPAEGVTSRSFAGCIPGT